MAELFAGTSGFAYTSWKPEFYPAELPSKQFLSHYSRRLNCVEINYTFRRLPAAKTLEGWIAATPPGFIFAVKVNQRITHILRLKNAGEATKQFLNAIEPLLAAKRLGPILFQLPPQLKCDAATLEAFLHELPRVLRCAFEFRHESWFCEPVYSLLRKRSVALCVAESGTLESPEVITADFIYYRFRKPEYEAKELRSITARLKEVLTSGRDVYAFFKHEGDPAGAIYAERFLKALAST
ncbi:MAG: DUF72 domain-containing protein [Acidobacteria bacterium]|nr:DUF72 domain-containing protein [Acidobacteriota bacterium]